MLIAAVCLQITIVFFQLKINISQIYVTNKFFFIYWIIHILIRIPNYCFFFYIKFSYIFFFNYMNEYYVRKTYIDLKKQKQIFCSLRCSHVPTRWRMYNVYVNV